WPMWPILFLLVLAWGIFIERAIYIAKAGIDKEKLLHGTMTGGGYVVYIKGIGDAVDESIAAVNEGAQAVFFMNPTRIAEVEAVSKNFECMPQKSTFFHPKVWTGFTIYKLS
ncbi:MAG: hypothetical protein ACMUIE_03960, partial [Thermoplasmatota archaeon]